MHPYWLYGEAAAFSELDPATIIPGLEGLCMQEPYKGNNTDTQIGPGCGRRGPCEIPRALPSAHMLPGGLSTISRAIIVTGDRRERWPGSGGQKNSPTRIMLHSPLLPESGAIATVCPRTEKINRTTFIQAALVGAGAAKLVDAGVSDWAIQ